MKELDEGTVRDSREDVEIIECILDGERELFEILMRRHNQKLYRVARGMGISDADCDDLIQITYIKSFEKLDQFLGQSAFSTWLTRILINECLMFRRKTSPVVSEEGTLHGFDAQLEQNDLHGERPATPENEMIKKELRAVLEASIEKLPDEYRVVYIMREVEDMSLRDIAGCLAISEANAKVRLFRARKLLQTQLLAYLTPNEIYEFGRSRCDKLVSAVLRIIL